MFLSRSDHLAFILKHKMFQLLIDISLNSNKNLCENTIVMRTTYLPTAGEAFIKTSTRMMSFLWVRNLGVCYFWGLNENRKDDVILNMTPENRQNFRTEQKLVFRLNTCKK